MRAGPRGRAARAAMAGGELRAPGGPERVALKKEIGLVSACAIIIGKGIASRLCAPAAVMTACSTRLCCRWGGGSGPAGAATCGGVAMHGSAGRCAVPGRRQHAIAWCGAARPVASWAASRRRCNTRSVLRCQLE